MAVPFYSTIDNVWEVEGSPRESFDKDTGITECRVKLRTPWTSRYAVRADLITPESVTVLGAGLPWPYNIDQSVNNATLNTDVFIRPPRVVSVDFESEGCLTVEGSLAETDQYHTYQEAILDVRYSNAYSIDSIFETFQPTAEFIKFDYLQYKWLTDDLPLSEGEAPGKLVKGATFTIKTERMDPQSLSTEFKDLVGSVNGGDFDLDSNLWGGITFLREELLYAQPVTEAVIDTTRLGIGHYLKTVARLVYKPGGWNKYWRPKIEDYDQFYKIGDGTKAPVINYPLKDWRIDPGGTPLQLPWLVGNGNQANAPVPPLP